MTYEELLWRKSIGYNCEPTTLTMLTLAVAAAGTGLTLAQQKQAADAQTDYQQELVRANNKAENLKGSELRQQEAQINESTAREHERARLAAQDSKASTVAALGESGITGTTVAQLLAEHDMVSGQYKETLNRQATLDRAQVDSAVHTGALGNVMSNRSINAPVSGPNYAAAAVNLAGTGLGVYRDYRAEKAAEQSKTPKGKTVNFGYQSGYVA